MFILQEVSRTRSFLYEFFTTSCNNKVKVSNELNSQLDQMEKIHNEQRSKLQGELLHACGKIRSIQDEIAKRGLYIVDQEQKLLYLSLHAPNPSGAAATERSWHLQNLHFPYCF